MPVNRTELQNRFWFTIVAAKICVTTCQTSNVMCPHLGATNGTYNKHFITLFKPP